MAIDHRFLNISPNSRQNSLSLFSLFFTPLKGIKVRGVTWLLETLVSKDEIAVLQSTTVNSSHG